MNEAISIPHHNGSSARPQSPLRSLRSLSLSKRPKHPTSPSRSTRSLSLSKRPTLNNKEAAPITWSGSYADGITDQSHLLPLTVMASHVNLPATDHLEMAPDKDRFPSCFLALRAKTLSEAKIKLDSKKHFEISCNMHESWERLVKSTSSALSQKKEHLPLVGQTLLDHQLWRASNNFSSLKSDTKIKHISESAKYSDSAFLLKKRASAARQMLPYSSLEERTLKVLVFPSAKIKHISESAKYSDSFVNELSLRSLSLSKRPAPTNKAATAFRTANTPLLYEAPLHFHLVPETPLSCTERHRNDVRPMLPKELRQSNRP